MDIHTQDVQYVVGVGGKPTAVLVNISVWEQILTALEDAEDLALIKEALSDLDAAGGDPNKAGFIAWEHARAELGQLDDAEE